MVITYPGLKILIKNEVLYMKELLNKKLTYGQLTRGVLNEDPKKGNSKEKQLNKIRSLCKLTIEEVMHGKKKNYIYDVICNKFFFKLNSTFKNDDLLVRIRNIESKKISFFILMRF